ncbi:porin family protein [Pedobacter yulinensis]|nr:porin family protein [Pedobacter yulinensis]
MKKTLSALICGVAVLALSVARPAAAQTRVGLQAGINFADVSAKNESGQKGETSPMAGLRIGLTADIPLGGDFFLQPGAFYVQKGFKQERGGYYGLANDFRVKVSYIDVPLHLLYKPALAGGRLLFGAGPYAAYGTDGTWTAENTILIGDIMTDNKGKTIFRNDYSEGEFGNYLYGKPWDFGLGLLAGYEFGGRISAQLNMQLGIANLEPETSGTRRSGSLYNRSFGLAVGYKF